MTRHQNPSSAITFIFYKAHRLELPAPSDLHQNWELKPRNTSNIYILTIQTDKNTTNIQGNYRSTPKL